MNTAYIKQSALSLALLMIAFFSQAETAPCADFFNHEYRVLHSDKKINLCSLYSGSKALLIVNTASHCGFTKQFGGLESLYQKYKDAGLQVVGFASNDFKQEAKNEAEAAGICYENYGVSFTMIAPGPVKGGAANPTFQHLNAATIEPDWNFNKYLVTENGSKIEHFGKRVTPLNSELETAVKSALNK